MIMARRLLSMFCAGLLCFCASAYAELVIDITRGVTDPVPVAVVPFARSVPADGGLDVAAVVQRDLESSGRYRGVDRGAMPSQPNRGADVDAARWRSARADYVVVGRISSGGDANVTLSFE